MVALYVSIFAEISLTPASPPERNDGRFSASSPPRVGKLLHLHEFGLPLIRGGLIEPGAGSGQLILLLGWKSGIDFFSTVFMKMADRQTVELVFMSEFFKLSTLLSGSTRVSKRVTRQAGLETIIM